ncbi:hypothetical protein LCGC14_2364690 [marine sediment metagenome]|uniref:PAC domain-containing protein n=1 Tax=marine sediment metagenome TaxID=412755 RepID=A0A0F9C5G6_9ZZZZ
MKIEISNGELVDKWTIVTIKLERIEDDAALENIRRESNLLTEGIQHLKVSNDLIGKLLEINIALWDVEDTLREMEGKQEFGEEFINTARSVYLLNDDRARIKKEINEQTNSLLVEEKSYKEYEVK